MGDDENRFKLFGMKLSNKDIKKIKRKRKKLWEMMIEDNISIYSIYLFYEFIELGIMGTLLFMGFALGRGLPMDEIIWKVGAAILVILVFARSRYRQNMDFIRNL